MIDDHDPTDFGHRLDRAAAGATAGVTLEPPGQRRPRRSIGAAPLAIAAGLLAIAALAGVLAFWPDGESPNEVTTTDGDGAAVLSNGDPTTPAAATENDDGDAPDADATTESATAAPAPCDQDAVLSVLQDGVPTVDYDPAGSYAAAADRALLVVAGRITEIRPAPATSSAGFTELVLTGVVGLDGRPPDPARFGEIDVIAYTAIATGEPVFQEDLRFVGFVTPWSGVRGGWAVGPEDLYIACGDNPVNAVFASAAGPREPTDPTIAELLDLAQLPFETEPTQPATFGVDQAQPIADAVIQFALGEPLAIEEIPLAEQVALGLGSEIVRSATNTELRDPAGWAVDRAEGYEGFVGPFSALDLIANRAQVDITVGPHDHCAGPPQAAPPGFEAHERISIQPAAGTIDSCIVWYAVDLFYDLDAGTIDAVTVSLFGP